MKLKTIFEELSSEKLLQKCVHGLTQNQNESFNDTIWKRIPKTRFVSRTQLEFTVNDAVANFNIGRKRSVLTFEKLRFLVPGRCTKGVNISTREDTQRVSTFQQEKIHKGCQHFNKRRYTKGVNISTRYTKGVNISTRYTKGVNISTRYTKGVNISTRYRKGVNISTRYTKGVNISTRYTKGVNISTREDFLILFTKIWKVRKSAEKLFVEI